MKNKNQFSKNKKILFLICIFLVNIYGCCNCYLEQTFNNTTKIKTEIDSLLTKATDNYVNQQMAINNTSNTIDNAINENKARKGCKTIGKSWSRIKNQEATGTYDQFLALWKKEGRLSSSFIEARKKQLHFDLEQIDSTENVIKEKKQKCN
jgi:hypothetical protein